MNNFDLQALPVDVKEKIFSIFPAQTLTDYFYEVCREWRTICDSLIHQRILRLQETVPNLELEECQSRRFPISELSVLKEYENTRLRNPFEMECEEICENVFRCDTTISNIWDARRCDCIDVATCATRVMQPMHCHNLFVVQYPERMVFFHETDIWRNNDEEGLTKKFNLNPYSCKPNPVRVDNNTHAAFSVYQDQVVAQETSRVLVLFRVTEVNHETRTVTIEKLRQIFLPLWSCALILYKTKVFALYTTGFIAVWDREEDEIEVSNIKCGVNAVFFETPLLNMRHTTMYRIVNLIFIRIVSDDDEGGEGSGESWTIFDAEKPNADGRFKLTPIDLNGLVQNTILDDGEFCRGINYISVWNNALIIYCNVHDGEEDNNNIDHGMIYVLRIRRLLQQDDFLSHEQFADALEYPVISRPFNGAITPLIYPPFFKPQLTLPPGNRVPVAAFIALNNVLPNPVNRRGANCLNMETMSIFNEASLTPPNN